MKLTAITAALILAYAGTASAAPVPQTGPGVGTPLLQQGVDAVSDKLHAWADAPKQVFGQVEQALKQRDDDAEYYMYRRGRPGSSGGKDTGAGSSSGTGAGRGGAGGSSPPSTPPGSPRPGSASGLYSPISDSQFGPSRSPSPFGNRPGGAGMGAPPNPSRNSGPSSPDMDPSRAAMPNGMLGPQRGGQGGAPQRPTLNTGVATGTGTGAGTGTGSGRGNTPWSPAPPPGSPSPPPPYSGAPNYSPGTDHTGATRPGNQGGSPAA